MKKTLLALAVISASTLFAASAQAYTKFSLTGYHDDYYVNLAFKGNTKLGFSQITSHSYDNTKETFNDIGNDITQERKFSMNIEAILTGAYLFDNQNKLSANLTWSEFASIAYQRERKDFEVRKEAEQRKRWEANRNRGTGSSSGSSGSRRSNSRLDSVEVLTPVTEERAGNYRRNSSRNNNHSSSSNNREFKSKFDKKGFKPVRPWREYYGPELKSWSVEYSNRTWGALRVTNRGFAYGQDNSKLKGIGGFIFKATTGIGKYGPMQTSGARQQVYLRLNKQDVTDYMALGATFTATDSDITKPKGTRIYSFGLYSDFDVYGTANFLVDIGRDRGNEYKKAHYQTMEVNYAYTIPYVDGLKTIAAYGHSDNRNYSKDNMKNSRSAVNSFTVGAEYTYNQYLKGSLNYNYTKENFTQFGNTKYIHDKTNTKSYNSVSFALGSTLWRDGSQVLYANLEGYFTHQYKTFGNQDPKKVSSGKENTKGIGIQLQYGFL